MRRTFCYLAALLLTAAAPIPKFLKPLSEADQSRIQEMGCESAFTVGSGTYVFAMNNRMVIRIATGPAICNIDNRIIDGFFEEGRPLGCSGMTLRLEQIARHKGNAEADSISGPSRLVVTRGTQRQILTGESGTAC